MDVLGSDIRSETRTRGIFGGQRSRVRRAYVLTQAFAFAGLLAAVRGTARTESLVDQANWVSLAIVALTLSGCANASWLVTGRRDVGRRQAALLGGLRTSGAGVAARVPESGQWIIREDGTRRHRPGCAFGKGGGARPWPHRSS